MFSGENAALDIRWDFKNIFHREPDWLGIVPAHVKLLGSHVELLGGNVSTLAVDHHLHIAAGFREDSIIYARNNDPALGEVRFSLEEMVPSSLVSWEEHIQSKYIQGGDWGNYVRAVCAHFGFLKGSQLRCGMNLFFSSETAVSGLLNFSSSLVLAMTLLIPKVHGWVYSHEELVEIAGCSELFSGKRGGWSDHGAMVFGRQDNMSHFRFFPFRISYSEFPGELSVIFARSSIRDKTSEEKKEIFNQRNVSFWIGLKLIHKNFPDLREKCPYIRDINAVNLGSEKQIYEILRSLPQVMQRKDIYIALPEEKEFLDTVFSSHSEKKPYFIRDVMCYGIAECERSRAGTELMENRKFSEFGKLMTISHDGDRLSSWHHGYKTEWKWHLTDDKITDYLENSGQASHDTISSIARIPGAYRCSTAEIDFIVDNLKDTPAVLGAKLMDDGLGEAVIILAEKERSGEVISLLEEKYYHPRKLPSSIFIFQPVDGARIEKASHEYCRYF